MKFRVENEEITIPDLSLSYIEECRQNNRTLCIEIDLIPDIRKGHLWERLIIFTDNDKEVLPYFTIDTINHSYDELSICKMWAQIMEEKYPDIVVYKDDYI